MALAGLTQQGVLEAVIAADLVANPNLLPPAISELSDQAAIFAFDQHAIYLPTGANEPGASIVNAETVTTAKILEADQRDRNRSIEDLNEISAAGARSREDLARLQETTAVYADGQFTMFGMTVEEDDLNTAIDNALQDYDAYADRHGIPQEDRAAHYSYLLALRGAPPQEQARMMTERAQASPSGEREMRGLMEDAAEIGQSHTRTADVTTGQAAEAQIVANAAPEIALEEATQGSVIDQQAVTWQTEDTELQREVLDRRGFASTQVDELVERQADSGDELAAMFGDVADDRQFADAGEVTGPAPRTDSNPALGLG